MRKVTLVVMLAGLALLGALPALAALAPQAPEGFTSLFTGQDLTGWTVQGDPSWTVEQGEIVCSGAGRGYLVSAGRYADFELMLEYKISRGGNSGVFMRASPASEPHSGFEVQVLDSSGQEPSIHTAGAVYDFITPCRDVARPYSRWNQLFVRCMDRQVVVVLNGVKVIDADIDQFPGLAQRNWYGHLMLQNHGSRVAYRRIYLREVTTPNRPIFDGETLTGWQVPSDKWVVKDGTIVCPGGGGGWLLSKKRYENFVFSLEYDTSGNSGITIRAAAQGDPAFTGSEIQVLQDSGQPPDIHSSASIYGALVPAANTTRPAGQWNRVVITCRGPHVTVVQNGVRIHDYSVTDPALNALEIQASKLRDRLRAGFVGFQDHGQAVRYRNVRLQELPAGGW